MATLFWDMDGTLSDPKAGMFNSYLYVCTQLGLVSPSDEMLLSFIGPPLRKNLAALLGTQDPKMVDIALSHYRHRYDKMGGMFENKLYPDIKEVLTILFQQGHTMYIVTSKPEHVAKPLAEHFEISVYFYGIYGAGPDGMPPKDVLIKKTLQNEGLTSSECLMIGNRRHDVIVAQQNGVSTIGVAWGYGSYTELKEAGAVSVVDTPKQLLECLPLILAKKSMAIKTPAIPTL